MAPVVTLRPQKLGRPFGMDRDQQALSALTPERLRGIRRGVEKESLRALPNGMLAKTSHPQALGSALTHPHITTDFSESQVELITGVHADPQACLDQLQHIQQFTLRAMGDERLWVSSMPPCLPADDEIPLGQYGDSNVGRAKTVYRAGLGHRYGRRMQTISGIHYNWSLPDVSSEQYFGLIRNFRRHASCCCTCLVPRRRCVPPLWRDASTSCKRSAPAPCTCPMPRRCAWGAWATRAMPRPRWR